MNPEFLEIYQYIRSCGNAHLCLNTNGGARNTDFWKELGKLKVEVTFSIDGLADTNHLYRRNVKWEKLMSNVNAFISAGGYAKWDFLIFKHNKHQINEAEEFSKKLGFKEFQTKENEAKRNDLEFMYVAAWQYNKDGKPKLFKEFLI